MKQWKKDIKAKYAALISNTKKLRMCLGDREEEIVRRKKDLKWNQHIEDKWRLYELHKRQQQHKQEWWKEKLEGELQVVEKKLEIEKNTMSSTNLPKLSSESFRIIYNLNRIALGTFGVVIVSLSLG